VTAINGSRKTKGEFFLKVTPATHLRTVVPTHLSCQRKLLHCRLFWSWQVLTNCLFWGRGWWKPFVSVSPQRLRQRREYSENTPTKVRARLSAVRKKTNQGKLRTLLGNAVVQPPSIYPGHLCTLQKSLSVILAAGFLALQSSQPAPTHFRFTWTVLEMGELTSNVVNTIFATEEKYASQRNWVCCLSANILSWSTDLVIEETWGKKGQSKTFNECERVGEHGLFSGQMWLGEILLPEGGPWTHRLLPWEP
jgi:hypothetical protein